jgi:hypothetical protein
MKTKLFHLWRLALNLYLSKNVFETAVVHSSEEATHFLHNSAGF